jgi:predicted amidophosphoribosyltransferase
MKNNLTFEYKCMTCKKELGAIGETIYCNGTLELSHGWGQCKECYAKDHRACVKCGNFLLDGFKFCPMCGTEIGSKKHDISENVHAL